jgi:hypothetical protein
MGRRAWVLVLNHGEIGEFADFLDGRRVPRAQSSQTTFTESHPARDVIRTFR